MLNDYICLVCKLKFEEIVNGKEVPTCPHCGSDYSEKIRISVSKYPKNGQLENWKVKK